MLSRQLLSIVWDPNRGVLERWQTLQHVIWMMLFKKTFERDRKEGEQQFRSSLVHFTCVGEGRRCACEVTFGIVLCDSGSK